MTVSETELWIEQARRHLKKARRGGSDAVTDSLKGHMTHIDLAQIQADLGCGDDCVACSWGYLGGQPLGSEPCRLLVLQQGIDDLHGHGGDKASRRREAGRLLQLLDSLPLRRK
jgi:hypothetical protein